MRIPFPIKKIHFLGIGGIGMSGIAEVLKAQGFNISGSDSNETANIQRLRALSIEIQIGQTEDESDGASFVVISSAIGQDNLALLGAKKRHIPIVRRAEMLAELMRLKWSICIGGTHGKTTTTSLIAHLLDSANMDPTVINGGIINAHNTNAILGLGDWLVAEADESDGSFVHLPSTVAVVTNIDPEHMENYTNFDEVRAAYLRFVSNVPFYGFSVLCLDHVEVQSLFAKLGDKRRVRTYGLNPQADVHLTRSRYATDGAHFDVRIACSKTQNTNGDDRVIKDLYLPMHGEHNVLNALSAIAIADEMGIDDAIIADGLKTFAGVKRRFTITGEINGVTVIDDYAHHPIEIEAVLSATRRLTEGRLIAISQPHRYTRMRDLFADFSGCFNDADTVFISDVYSAGENPIKGYSGESLVKSLIKHGHRDVRYLPDPSVLPTVIGELVQPDDMVIFLGAGNITNWANEFPDLLKQKISTK